MASPLIFDRAALRRRRERAAPKSHEFDFLLRAAAGDLLDRLEAVTREFAAAADLGMHHPLLTEGLLARAGRGHVINAGVPALPCDSRALTVRASEDALPFRDASLDLAISCLSLQFVNDLPGTLIQIRRALKPDGMFLAALMGGETLKELREAFLAAEIEMSGGAAPRVAPMADIRDLGGLLQRAGFALPVADASRLRVTYPDAFALMRDLRGMGAGNVLAERSRKPLRRAVLMRAARIYAERFPAEDGRVEATFEIVYLTGWAPHESQQQPLRPGSARTRLADALGAVEQPVGDKTSTPRRA